MKRMLVAAAAGLLLFGMARTCPTWAAAGEGVLASLQQELTGLLDRVKPSLVTVEAAETEPQTEAVTRRRMGSGVVWDSQGTILTAAAVVGGSEHARVTLQDGRKLLGSILGVDDTYDLAVVKVETTGLAPIPLGNSDLCQPGWLVTVVGNSYGIPASISLGSVSGIRPDDGLLQISASVSPGNSGGPVLDPQGNVLGIVTARPSDSYMFRILADKEGQTASAEKAKQAALSYALAMPAAGVALVLPINKVKIICEDLTKGEKRERGYLGVYIQELTAELAEHFKGKEGILVSDVQKDTPAAKAGLRDGDIITEFDGKEVSNTGDFREQVAETKPGKEVKIKVISGGKARTVKVKVGRAPVSTSLMKEWKLDVPEIHLPDILGDAYTKEYLKESKDLEEAIRRAVEKDDKESLEKSVKKLQEQIEQLIEDVRKLREDTKKK
jgi:S1-C subfamily serine protease